MSKNTLLIKKIVIIALFSALLTGGKLALMYIPNVEIVTILIILYSYSFGLKISLPVTFIFCITEGFLFGFNTWLITYFIHWPMLALASGIAALLKIKKTYIYVAIGGILTIMFGFTSSVIDALISSQISKINFFTMFSIIYLRGISFYLTQVISNIIFISIGFPVLSELFLKAKKSYFPEHKKLLN